MSDTGRTPEQEGGRENAGMELVTPERAAASLAEWAAEKPPGTASTRKGGERMLTEWSYTNPGEVKADVRLVLADRERLVAERDEARRGWARQGERAEQAEYALADFEAQVAALQEETRVLRLEIVKKDATISMLNERIYSLGGDAPEA